MAARYQMTHEPGPVHRPEVGNRCFIEHKSWNKIKWEFIVHHKLLRSSGPDGRCCRPQPGQWRCIFLLWRKLKTWCCPGSQWAEKHIRRRRVESERHRDYSTCFTSFITKGAQERKNPASPLFCYQATSSKWPSPRSGGAGRPWSSPLCSWRPPMERRAGPVQDDLQREKGLCSLTH